MDMLPFPDEFSDILTPFGRAVLKGKARAARGLFSRIVVLPQVIKPRIAASLIQVLDRNLYPRLLTIERKIPRTSITEMTENYTEKLPKALHVKSAHLHSRGCQGYAAAAKINLIPMLRSPSLLAFAESVTGLKLLPGMGCQALCYEHSHYVGPHNDHHPESEDAAIGYVDFHIMLSNRHVSHQWLVYEEKGHLSSVVDISLPVGVAVYKLPFWHYTTPLSGRAGYESLARSWVLISSFGVQSPRKRRG